MNGTPKQRELILRVCGAITHEEGFKAALLLQRPHVDEDDKITRDQIAKSYQYRHNMDALCISDWLRDHLPGRTYNILKTLMEEEESNEP